MTKKLYLVESQTVIRLFYLVASEEIPNGKVSEAIIRGDFEELGQQFLGEKFCGSTEVKHTVEAVRKEYVKLNPQCEPTQLDETFLLSLINHVDEPVDGSGD